MRHSAAARSVLLFVNLLAATVHADVRYSAKTNYTLHCQGCHGSDGIGALPERVPPLANSVGHFLRVPDGRRYLVQVPGVAYAAIDDADLAELLNFVLQNFSASQLPPSFQPYTAEEVARVRRGREDVVALRAKLATELHQYSGVCLWMPGDSSWASNCEGAYGPVH